MSGAPSCCAAQIRPSTKPGCSGEKKQGPGQAPRSLPTCRHRRLTARDKPLLAAKHLSPSTVAAALRHHCAVPKLPWPLLAKAPATTSGARRRARGSCPANQRSRRARPWWVAQTEPRLTDGRRAGQPCLVTLGPELLCVGQPQAPGLHPRQAAVSAVSAARPPAQPPSSLPSVIPPGHKRRSLWVNGGRDTPVATSPTKGRELAPEELGFVRRSPAAVYENEPCPPQQHS